MENIFNLSNIIGVLINSFAYIYLWSKLAEEKINFKSIKYYFIHISFAIIMVANHTFMNAVLRILVMIIIMSIFCSMLFNKNFKECFIIAFVSQIIEMIGELVFVVILMIINSGDISALVSSNTPLLSVNIFVLLFCVLVMQFNLFKKTYNYILRVTDGVKRKNLFIIMIICLISINFIFLAVYYKYDIVYTLTINAFMSLLYLFICIRFFNTENKYNKINSKYNNTLNSLREYEEILDVYIVSNHENKNQLLTIRSMIVKKEKNIPEYIDKIIDNNIKDDEKLMFDTNAIPAGGLRAVIYSKLLVMKDKKIKFKLNVDRKVRTVELIDLGEELMLDVCKVIGVFLDNAIEAVLDLNKKNITISLFTDGENLNIEISNNFEGDIDLTKIDDKGYTSKTKGHGYGLSLVKEIISKNNKLKNERKINKNIFTQKLKIKIK